MKFLLAAAVLLAATSPAFATVRAAPGAELATGIPAGLAVVGAFAATRFARKK